MFNDRNPIPARDLPAREVLARHIRNAGPIPALRVSSAQARGAAKKWCYWGVATWDIDIRKSDGLPIARPINRAPSSRRAEWLAHEDCRAMAAESGDYIVDAIPGPLSDDQCQRVIDWLATTRGYEGIAA